MNEMGVNKSKHMVKTEILRSSFKSSLDSSNPIFFEASQTGDKVTKGACGKIFKDK